MDVSNHQPWQTQKKKGSKRKNDSASSLVNPSKKHFNDDLNLKNLSLPLRESTPIEINETDDEAIKVDLNFKPVDRNKETVDENVKLKDTIEFLRKLVETKDDIINLRDTENSFLSTRIANLEALLLEKDKFVKKFTAQVDSLGKMSQGVSREIATAVTVTDDVTSRKSSEPMKLNSKKVEKSFKGRNASMKIKEGVNWE